MIKIFFKFPRLLCFGILCAFFSGPGQTFLISLFIPHMRDAFSLNQATIAGYYSFATFLSALVLPFTGRLLDRSNLTWFGLGAGLLLILGCLLLSWSPHILVMAAGFFLIRNLGQGTLTMLSSTTMAKQFGPIRGKALGISNLGYPLSEALFPAMITVWLASYGWRSGWLFLATLIAVLFLPGVFFLLRNNPHVELSEEELNVGVGPRAYPESDQGRAQGPAPTKTRFEDWTVQRIIRDWRFLLLMIPIMIPPTFFTGLFFHHVAILEMKGWDAPKIIAVGFLFFGVFRAISSFLIGPVIDKLSARSTFPINLIPFTIGLGFLLYGASQFWGYVYLALAGVTMGLGQTTSSALYAELYGTKALGSIKGLTSSIMVFSTAVAPILLGILLDQGISLSMLIWGMVTVLFSGSCIAFLVCKQVVSNGNS